MFKHISALLIVLLVVSQFPAYGQRGITVEDVLSGRVSVVAIANPSRIKSTSSISVAPCWTTNDLNVPPWQGGWPVTSTFFAGDLLAYATGPIRVTAEDPGPHPIAMHVENFAEIRGTYKHLTRADLDFSTEIFNEPGFEFTDWWLAVFRTVPEILRLIQPFPKQVDWTNTVSGYANYECSSSLTLSPIPENGAFLAIPARSVPSPLQALLSWVGIKR